MKAFLATCVLSLPLLACPGNAQPRPGTVAQAPPGNMPSLSDLLGIPGFAPPGTASGTAGRPRLPSPAPAMQTPALSDKDMAAMRQSHGSCFGAARGENEWSLRAAAATVQVVQVTPHGTSTASGTVVRGSQHMPGGANAILTAFHVVDEASKGGPGTAIGIMSTNGEPLGWAEVVARGRAAQHTSGGDRLDSSESGDVAVLRIRGFMGNGEQVFKQIEGVDVSRSLNTHILRGEVSNPVGTNPGISGAAALDAAGYVYGVVIRRSTKTQTVGNWTVKGVKYSGADPMLRPAPDGYRTMKTVVLPQSSTTYVEPLLHAEVLAALGGAATEVVVRDGGSDSVATTMMGFPSGLCAVYHGLMKPM